MFGSCFAFKILLSSCRIILASTTTTAPSSLTRTRAICLCSIALELGKQFSVYKTDGSTSLHNFEKPHDISWISLTLLHNTCTTKPHMNNHILDTSWWQIYSLGTHLTETILVHKNFPCLCKWLLYSCTVFMPGRYIGWREEIGHVSNTVIKNSCVC